MIPRYSRPEMARVWEPENRFKIWLEIEMLAVEACSKLGRVPAADLATIKGKAAFQIDRIEAIEQQTKHDVIAFVTNVAENVGPAGRWLHYGLTSSDVLDTCFSLQLRQSSDLILQDLDKLLVVLKRRAEEFKLTPVIGRSHGIHAEPTTFGLKLLGWYEEIRRQRQRIEDVRKEVSIGKVSGAVGNYAHGEPEVERYVCEKLGLTPDLVATQIVSRDRYAPFFLGLALLAASIEKIATEIRHLQRTEVLEAEEFFSPGQKGSSAMPHKRNPILSENLCGLARLVRSYANVALENVPLWHERDISHSSAERMMGPDAAILTDFMLSRLTGLLEKLIVYPKNMASNLGKFGKLVYSEGVLLKLISSGLTREEAYKLVQDNAMKAWQGNEDFEELVKKDPKIGQRIKAKELTELFCLEHVLRHVETIFERVLG